MRNGSKVKNRMPPKAKGYQSFYAALPKREYEQVKLIAECYDSTDEAQLNDSKFIALAANSSANLARALCVALDGLERINKMSVEGSRFEHVSNEAIERIEAIFAEVNRE